MKEKERRKVKEGNKKMIFDILDLLLDGIPRSAGGKKKQFFQRSFCPAVSAVFTDDVSTTVVKFADGSKVTVRLSENDKFCLETAVLNALVKRTFCTGFSGDGEAESQGLGNALRKVLAGAVHSGKQGAGKQDAGKQQKKVSAVSKKVDKFLAENPGKKKGRSVGGWVSAEEFFASGDNDFRRPAGPFREWSQEKKREYWRWQKQKNRLG